MADTAHAYNTVWQLRADAWCRLEEAADRLSRPTTPELKERYVGIVGDLLTVLTPLEPYWAYPGSPQFAKMQRLFAAGHHGKFARAVSRINRALTTDSYRSRGRRDRRARRAGTVAHRSASTRPAPHADQGTAVLRGACR
jgi:arginine decarboxylase